MIRVLAIDDNPDNLISLKAIINDALPETEILTAMSGFTGIALAIAEDPDVILLDIVMPEMDGFEVCRQLKRDEQVRDIPVVFLTALKNNKNSRIRALEIGAEGFLLKPIDETELIAQIRAMVKVKTANRLIRNDKERLTLLVSERTKELNRSHQAAIELLENLKAENETRRKIEEALRESEEKYRGVVEKSLTGIILADESGNIIEWNRSQEIITGYKKEEFLGKPIWDAQFKMLLPDKQTTEIYNQNKLKLLAILQDHKSEFFDVTNEWKILRPDGSVRSIENIVYPVKTEKRYLIGSVTRDITEKKESEDALKEMNRGLLVLNEAAMKFTGESFGSGLYMDIARQLKKMTGAITTTIGVYDPKEKCIHIKHADLDQSIEEDLYHALGNRNVTEVDFPINDSLYKLLLSKPIDCSFSLNEATFGVIPKTVGNTLQALKGVDRFYTVAHFINTELYGTSVIALRAITPDPPLELLKSYAYMVAIALRRNKAEEELRESEEKYRGIFENVQDVYYEVSLDGVLLDVSPSIENFTYGQYTQDDLKKAPIDDFYVDASDRREFLDLIKRKGKVTDYEIGLLNRDGSIIFCTISANLKMNSLGQPEKIVGSIHNIDERKKAEDALRESENKFRTLVNEMQLGLAVHRIILDKDGNPVDYMFLDINPSFEKLTGLVRENIIGKTVLEILPNTEKYWIEKYGEVVCTGKPLCFENFSEEFGKYYSVVAYRTQEHEFAVSIEDITAQKQSADKIAKTNRINSVISKINQAIVHLRDKKELSEEVCRIAIEYGEFRMAWIGLNDEKTKVIKPFAFSGAEDGYLAKIVQISNEDKPEGHGPTGSAIRKSEFDVCNDIDNDPRMEIWKEEAKKRGYASSIAFPLKQNQKVIGVFTLYSGITNFFNEEEIKLLSDVVDNISYAFEAIETEHKRKQIEHSLTESETLFRSMSENSLTGIYIISNIILQYANPALTKIFGYQPEEILGRSILNLIHPDDQAIVEENIRKRTEQNITSLKYEIRGRKKNGETINVLILGGVAYLGNQQVIIGNMLDITEQKKAEASLEKAEKYFRLLIEKAPDGIGLIGANGKLIYASPSAKKIYGFSETETTFPNPTEYTHPEDLPRILDAIGFVMKNPTAVSNEEYRFRKPDGSWIWVESTFSNQFGEEGIDALVINFKDITERKRNEQKQELIYKIAESVNTTNNLDELLSFIRSELNPLIDTTNFFVALYDDAKDLITLPFYVDLKDQYSSFPAGKTMTGYLIKSKKSIFAKRSDIEKLESEGTIETIGSRSKVWLGVPLKVKNVVTGAIVVQNYENENAFNLGDLDFLEFVSSTISIAIDRKKGEEELKAAMQQAMESDRLKSAFLTNMSHEIRTPMNAIMGFSNLMVEVDGEEKDHFASIIQKSSKQLLSLIDDIVYLSRLQTEKITIQPSAFRPSELVTDVYQMFNLPDLKKGLEIILSLPGKYQNLILNSDVAKIKQVLTNLATNAVKYTNRGSIEIGFEIKGEYVEFYVKDTGIGIPKEEQKRIFDSFFRGQQVITAAIGGTGLGLNIARELVEILGGKIWVESTPNEGSQFYFTIPLEQSDKVQTESQLPVATHKNWKELNLLIAEDEPDNYFFLEILLHDQFNRIDHAQNGKEAIELTMKNKYDLILMDLKMPVLGGIEAIQEIKKEYPYLPIIAQTAYALPDERARAIEAGCDDYLTKPIRKADLFNAINKFT